MKTLTKVQHAGILIAALLWSPSLSSQETQASTSNLSDSSVDTAEHSIPSDPAERRRYWQSLPEEKKNEFRRKHERFKNLSPEQKKQLRQKLQRWKSLSPEKRQRAKNKWRRFQQLPPDKKEKIRAKLKEFRSLPPGEREKRKKEFRQWKQESRARGSEKPLQGARKKR